MTYYYTCSYPLENGSIVSPGNWGRIIKRYTPVSGSPWIFIREMVYEEVRRNKYPKKPSRFESIFMCSTEEGLNEFIGSRPYDLAYEVEVVDNNKPLHEGCLENPVISDFDNYYILLQKAEEYWQSKNIVNREIVTTSPIKIIRRI